MEHRSVQQRNNLAPAGYWAVFRMFARMVQIIGTAETNTAVSYINDRIGSPHATTGLRSQVAKRVNPDKGFIEEDMHSGHWWQRWLHRSPYSKPQLNGFQFFSPTQCHFGVVHS